MNRMLKRMVTSILCGLMISGIGLEPLHALADYQIIDYGDGDRYEGNAEQVFYYDAADDYDDSYAYDDDEDTAAQQNVTVGYEKSGEGTYYSRTGAVIKGTWKDNYLTGKGKIVYSDGARYVGMFKKDVRSGKGKYYFKNGDVYNGNWKNDQMHGKGKYTWKKKWTLTGSWKNGKINGKCVFKNSKYVYTLSVKNGKLKKVISRRKK